MRVVRCQHVCSFSVSCHCSSCPFYLRLSIWLLLNPLRVDFSLTLRRKLSLTSSTPSDSGSLLPLRSYLVHVSVTVLITSFCHYLFICLSRSTHLLCFSERPDTKHSPGHSAEWNEEWRRGKNTLISSLKECLVTHFNTDNHLDTRSSHKTLGGRLSKESLTEKELFGKESGFNFLLTCNKPSQILMLQTKPGPPKKPKTPSGQSALVYCYNCGQEGHYGHVSLSSVGA